MSGSWDTDKIPPEPHGDPKSYELAAELFDGMSVQDWGSGEGYFKYLYGDSAYTIGDKPGPWIDEVADLTEFTSNTPGLMMRHIVEHSYDFDKILRNANESFTKLMILVLSTPMSSSKPYALTWKSESEVPDISFRHRFLATYFPGCDFRSTDIRSKSKYLHERIYTIKRL